MGHVIEHIAQETPCKDDACHGLRQDEPQEHIEEGNHQRGWHWGEDQAGAIKGCLWAERCGYQRQPKTDGLFVVAVCQSADAPRGVQQSSVPMRGQWPVLGRLGICATLGQVGQQA